MNWTDEELKQQLEFFDNLLIDNIFDLTSTSDEIWQTKIKIENQLIITIKGNIELMQKLTK